MTNKNLSIYALIALSSLQLHGMQNQSKQYSPRPQINLPVVNNKLPSLKRPSEDILDFTGLEKKAKIDNPISCHSQEKTNTSLEKEQGSQPYPIIITSPEEEQGSQVCPIAIGSQDENRQIDPLQTTLSTRIKQTITNFDFNTLGNLLITNEATQLSKEQKEELYTHSQQRKKDLKRLCKATNVFASNIDNEEIKAKFSYDTEYKNIQKISRHLYALKTLPRLTFPQAFFTNAPTFPHGKNITQPTTPEQALIALIKNEQEKISICCFHFNLMSIANALVRKKNNGILVEVITNQDQGKGNEPLKAINLLLQNNIAVLSPQDDIMEDNHHKFATFNHNLHNAPLLSSGSFNYTDHAMKRSWDDMTITNNSEIIEAFHNRFKEVKGRSKEFKATQRMQRQNNYDYNNNNH